MTEPNKTSITFEQEGTAFERQNNQPKPLQPQNGTASSTRRTSTIVGCTMLLLILVVFSNALFASPAQEVLYNAMTTRKNTNFSQSTKPIQGRPSFAAASNETNTTKTLIFSPVSSVQQKQNTHNNTQPKKGFCDSKTTIIVTSNLIPTHPSIEILNETMSSLRLLKGLCPTAPLVITVDGLNAPKAAHQREQQRWDQYVQNLQNAYGALPHVTLLVSPVHLHLGGSLANAMYKAVKTERIMVIQHDIPFVQQVNWTALVRAMDSLPDQLRLVRFNHRVNTMRPLENHTCFGEPSYSPVPDKDGLRFTRSPLWSDR